MNFGFGACSADLTYFVLLLSGVLVFLQQDIVLRVIGIIGSGILTWFGISALRLRVKSSDENGLPQIKKPLMWRNYFQGYGLTLLNPLTILFWASLSTQLAVLSRYGTGSVIYAGIGILTGTVSWVIAENSILHFTRHRFSERTMRYLNYLGGIIILCFAVIGLWRALHG
jgi:threonine/homoserine/homoserine lactone efflux protein